MLSVANLQAYPWAGRSRARFFIGPESRAAITEMLALLLAGFLAAAAVAFIHVSWRIPGHAILRGALPMVAGVAVAPRRWSGTLIGIIAGIAFALFASCGAEDVQLPAVVATVGLGPAIDLCLMRSSGAKGWLYARFAFAGLMANLVAFGFRWGIRSFGVDSGQGHSMRQIGWYPLMTFAACGIAAGLLSAIICFRYRSSTSQDSVT